MDERKIRDTDTVGRRVVRKKFGSAILCWIMSEVQLYNKKQMYVILARQLRYFVETLTNKGLAINCDPPVLRSC